MEAAELLFTLLLTGFALVFIGVLLVFIGGLVRSGARTEGGGVVFIGPIPIVFGTTSSITRGMLILALALTAMLLLLFLLLTWLPRWLPLWS